MEKFDQKKYVQEYNKKKYKAFKVDLKKEELEVLDSILKEKNISKADFLRNAINKIKKN